MALRVLLRGFARVGLDASQGETVVVDWIGVYGPTVGDVFGRVNYCAGVIRAAGIVPRAWESAEWGRTTVSTMFMLRFTVAIYQELVFRTVAFCGCFCLPGELHSTYSVARGLGPSAAYHVGLSVLSLRGLPVLPS